MIDRDTPTTKIVADHARQEGKTIRLGAIKRRGGGPYSWTVTVSGLPPVVLACSRTRELALNGRLVSYVRELKQAKNLGY